MKDDDMELDDGIDSLQILMDAEEIKKDKKRLKAALKQAKEKMATIKSIQDLKTAYNAKYGEGRLMKEKHEKIETAMHEKAEDKDEKKES